MNFLLNQLACTGIGQAGVLAVGSLKAINLQAPKFLNMKRAGDSLQNRSDSITN